MAEATHTSTGQAAEHSGVFPPFQTETFASQLLWLAIAFGILYYMMSKVALPRVTDVLENRRERMARDLADAEAMRSQSEAAGAAYQASLAEAHNRAKEIAQETRNALAAEADSRRKALEADLAAKIAESEAAIRARTEEAMASVRGIAADTASAIVERLTGRAPDPSAVAVATNRVLSA
jgi:F-type H+-transporting ATPase subunit b